MPVSYKEFAAQIKAKYPEYGDIDDLELSNKIIEKYPEYKAQVSFDSGVKFDDYSKKLGAVQPKVNTSMYVTPELEKQAQEQAVPQNTQPLSPEEANSVIYGGIPGTTKVGNVNIAPIGKDWQQQAAQMPTEQPTTMQGVNAVAPKVEALTSTFDAEQIAKEDKKPGFSDFYSSYWNKLNQGAASGFAGLAQYGEMVYNDLSDLTNYKWTKPLSTLFDSYSKTYRSIGDFFKNDAEFSRQNADIYNGKDYVQLMKEGRPLAAAGQVYLEAAASAPTTIEAIGLTLAGAPQAALPLFYVQAAGQKYDELRDKDMNGLVKGLNVHLTGLLEAATERFGDMVAAKAIVSKFGADKVKQAATSVFEKWIAQSLEKSALLTPTVMEGASEAANSLGQQFVDLATGVDTKIDGKEILDSFVFGIVGGSQFGAIASAKGLYDKKKYEKQFNDADRSLVAMLSRNGFTAEDVADIKNSLLQATPENRNSVVVAISQAIDGAITKTDGKVSFSPEVSKTFTDFLLSSDRLQAVNTKYNQSIEAERAETLRLEQEQQTILNEKQQAADQLQSIASPDGMIRTVKMMDGTEMVIRGEKVVFDPETGRLDRKNSSEMLYYTDENGEVQVLNPKRIDSILSEKPIEQAAFETDQLIDQEISDKELDEFLPLQPETYQDAQGTIQVQYNPQTSEIEAVLVDEQSMTPISEPYTIDKATYAQMSGKQLPETIKTTANEPLNDGSAPVVSGDMTENAPATAEAIAEAVIPTTEVPIDEQGNMLFEQAAPEITVAKLSEFFEPEEVVATIKAKVADIQKQIEKTGKFKATGNIQKDIQAKQAQKAQLEQLNSQLQYWNSVDALITPQAQEIAPVQPEIAPVVEVQPKAETKTKPAKQPKEKSKGAFVQPKIAKSLREAGEPQSLRELIMMKLMAGQKLKWDDVKSETGAILSRGLGAEYRYSAAEKKPRANNWYGYIEKSDEGITPEQFAHNIWETNAFESGQFEDMPLYGLDTQDILNEILDVVNSYSTTGRMADGLNEARLKLSKDEQAHIDNAINAPDEIVDSFDDYMLASFLELSNFTPEQISELNTFIDGWEENIPNYAEDNIDPTAEGGSAEDSQAVEGDNGNQERPESGNSDSGIYGAAEKEAARIDERKQRILSDGTGFDEPFGLIPVSEIKSAAEIQANIEKIITTLKDNQGNGYFLGFEGFAMRSKYAKNAGEQIRGYFMSIDVLPLEIRKEFAESIGITTNDELVSWGEKKYNEFKSKPYASSNADAIEEAQKPPMTDSEVRSEYLRADLTREIDNANVPPVAENELRSRFNLENNNGTQLTNSQKQLVDEAELSIRKKLGKAYPELQVKNQPKKENKTEKVPESGNMVELDPKMIIGEYELKNIVKNSPTPNMEDFQREAVGSYIHLVQPNETVSGKELAKRIANNYDPFLRRVRVDLSAIYYIDGDIKHTLNGISIKGKFKGNESKAEIKPVEKPAEIKSIENNLPGVSEIELIQQMYDDSVQYTTMNDVIQAIANVASENDIKPILEAYDKYQKDKEEDRLQWGERGDREQMENDFMQVVNDYMNQSEQPLEKATVEKLVSENTIIAEDKKKQTIDRLNSVINKEIDNKDIVKTIEYLSDTLNEQTRSIFAQITGVKLPATIKGSEATLREYVGLPAKEKLFLTKGEAKKVISENIRKNVFLQTGKRDWQDGKKSYPVNPSLVKIFSIDEKEVDFSYDLESDEPTHTINIDNIRDVVVDGVSTIGDTKLEGIVKDLFAPSGNKLPEQLSTEQIQNETDLNPTEAQKKAGNYKKAHIAVSGMDISIENPVGSVRSGKDEDGKAWEHEMKSHYGYFLKTEGKDGDHIDTFIREGIPSDWNGTVFPIDQINPKTGAFDETKVMIGYETPEEAKAAYLENYDKDWKGFYAITEVSVDDFKTWLYDGKKQNKPFAEYKDTPAPVEQAEKQPWEMTREEWNNPTNHKLIDKFTINHYRGKGGLSDAWAISTFLSENKLPSFQELLNLSDKEKAKINAKFKESDYSKFDSFDEFHKQAIKQALSEGKQVPENVLADYPELKQAEVKPEVKNEIPISEDGLYQIREVKVKKNDGSIVNMFAVPTANSKGLGEKFNDLFDTIEEAVEGARQNRIEQQRDEERDAAYLEEKRLAAEAKAAKAKANEGKTPAQIMQEAREKSIIDKWGKEVEKRLADGYEFKVVDEVDKAAENKREDHIAYLNKVAPWGNERHPQTIELNQLKADVKAGKRLTKKSYRLDKNGMFIEVPKTVLDYYTSKQAEVTKPKETVKEEKQTSPELELVTVSTELATAKAKYEKAYNKYLDLKKKLEKDPAFGMGGQVDIYNNVSGADNLFGNDGQKQAVEAVQAAKKQADDLKPAVDELQAKADKLREAVTNKILKQQEVKFEEEVPVKPTIEGEPATKEQLSKMVDAPWLAKTLADAIKEPFETFKAKQQYLVDMQAKFLDERGITEEDMKNYTPEDIKTLQEEAKIWLKDQEAKLKRFNPDDKLTFTAKNGEKMEVNFRGYSDSKETKAVIAGKFGQMEVDVNQLERPKVDTSTQKVDSSAPKVDSLLPSVEEQLKATAAKYGWTVKRSANGFELVNRKGNTAAILTIDAAKGKYSFNYPDGEKILSGNKNVSEALDKVIKGNFYGEEVSPEQPLTPENLFDNSTNTKDRLRSAKQIISKLEKSLSIGTTPVSIHETTADFLEAYKAIVSDSDYQEAVKFAASGQRLSGVRINEKVLINVEHNPKATDLIGTYMHETGHKAFDIVFLGENFDNVVVDDVESFIPDVYWGEDNRTKISEAVAHQIEELLNDYTPEQIKNGDVDVSLLDERIIYPLTKTLNKLTNGKVDIIGQKRFNDLRSISRSNGGIQNDGHKGNDNAPKTKDGERDNGIPETERDRKKRELAERLKNKLKPDFKRSLPATINIDGVERPTTNSTGNNGGFEAGTPNINFKKFDPELNAIAMELSEMIFEDGDVSFESYSAQMLEYVGEQIRPLLKPYYEMARVTLEAPNMTSADEVHKYDITNFNHKQYVSNRAGSGKQDSPRTNEVPGDAEIIPDNGSGSGQVGNGIKKNSVRKGGRGRSASNRSVQPSLFGEPSDNEVPETNEGQPVKKPTTGDTDGRGNGIDSTEGHSDFDGRANESDNKADVGVSETFKQRVARKLIEQQKAESIPVKSMDIDNIRETLPFLLSEQQDDVLKAETRFFGEAHQNKKGAFGKGMLFTNGTGTGKTYTGLGIAKRFAKQGKGNILIVVPSEAKVLDWAKDGKNLGLEITPLSDTKDAGTGAVVTTYANFRANEALKERDFDLVMYDESHRLMEEKTGKTSSTTNAHYAHSNVTEHQAFYRLQSVNPDYIKIQELHEKLKHYGQNKDNSLAKAIEKDLDERWKAYHANVKPGLIERAKQAYNNTKVVFLSATPFKAHFNLRYANGSLFDWGNETTYQQASRTMSSVDAESQFFLDNFGSAYEWKFHRLQSKKNSNAEAIAMQEVQFAENLIANGAMSGRAIESDKDYSREFPRVTLDNADTFNTALNEIMSNDAPFGALRDAAMNVFRDYNYTTKLFESLKASMSIPRIQDHLDLGRKLVIFHRRKQADVLPPFQSVLDMARTEAQYMAHEAQNMEDGQKKDELNAKIDLIYNHIEGFQSRYADLLKWEQTLDYSPAIDQLKRAFGEKVVFINGDTSKKDKPGNINKFNDDNSEVKIIVVQEEAGKEGISLHDTTGKHPRVLMNLSLPISSTTTLQIEGRVYRIGQESNVPFEYPLLGIDQEISDFGNKINKKLSTTENLAMGNQARDLLRSFAEGVLFNQGTEKPHINQGAGGKEYDKKTQSELSEFRKAVLVYQSNQKVRGSRDSREGKDYYATPEPLGQKMVEFLGLQAGESAMEPSAGHGAIAMWFPDKVSSTVIEPSYSLYTKLNARAGGGNRKMVNDIFENYNIINKYHGIAMNPPFGSGGKTAVDHVEKAFGHLHNNGRVVAIIPQGQADKRLEDFLERTPNAHLIASVKLPSSTFEQAGTSVSTRIVVIDRVDMPKRQSIWTQVVMDNFNAKKFDVNDEQTNAEVDRRLNDFRNNLPRTQRMDLSYVENIDELFNEIEDLSVDPRQRAVEAQSQADEAALSKGKFEQFEQKHGKTGETMFMVAPTEYHEKEVFNKLVSIAKENNGYYSSYSSKPQNVRSGFTFKTKEDADNFSIAANKELSKPEFKIIGERGAANLDAAEEATKSPVVYHASKSKFDKFNIDLLGSNTGAESAKEGIFFATNKDVAISYASKANDKYNELLAAKEKAEKELSDITGGQTPESYSYGKRNHYRMEYGNTPEEIAENNTKIEKIFEKIKAFDEYDSTFTNEPIWNENRISEEGQLKEVRLRYNNPFVHDYKGESFRDKTYAEIIKKAKADGHDAVIFKNTFDGNNPYTRNKQTDIYVVFSPEQVTDSKAEEATTRLDNLRVAKEMEATKTPQEIRLATGWEKGVDGLWRYEQPDGNLKGVLDIDKRPTRNNNKPQGLNTNSQLYFVDILSNVLSDDNLFKAYPEFKDMPVLISNYMEGIGSYNPIYKTIQFNVALWTDYGRRYLGLSNFEEVKDKIKSVLIHEIQHAIQYNEGFAKGGSPTSFAQARYNINTLFKDIENAFDKLGYEDWLINGGKVDTTPNRNFNGMYSFAETQNKSVRDRMVSKLDEANKVINENKSIFGKVNIYDNIKDEELYRRLAGETEARNVQERMNFTADERRQRLLSETADVAPEDQIVLMDAVGVSESRQVQPLMQKPPRPEYPVFTNKDNALDRIKKLQAYNEANKQWVKDNYDFMPEGAFGNSFKDQFTLLVQDKERYPLVFQREIQNMMGWTEKTIPDTMDWYKQHEHLSSKNGHQIDQYNKEMYSPFMVSLARVTAQTESMPLASDYMIISHAIERNQFNVDKRVSEFEKAEYAKLEKLLAERAWSIERALTARERYYTKALKDGNVTQEKFEEIIAANEKIRNAYPAKIQKSRVRRSKTIDNNVIEFRDKIQETDYSGAYTILKEYGFEESRQGLEDFVKDFEGKYEVGDLWQRNKAANDYVLDKLYEGQIITADTRDELKTRWSKYVPLRGFDEIATADDLFGEAYHGYSNSGYNNPLKTMKGRKSRPEDPFKHILSMAETAILRTNKNLVNQTLNNIANFIPENPYVFASKTWYIRESAESEWVEVAEKPEQRYFDEGNVKFDKNQLGFAIFKPYQEKEHDVVVYVNGNKKVITFTDPRVANGINGNSKTVERVRSAIDAPVIKQWHKLNTFIKQSFTSYSPNFIIKNGMRDAEQVIYTLSVNNPEMLAPFMQYFTPFESITTLKNGVNGQGTLSAIFRYLFLKPDMNFKADKYLQEFLEQGVPTGIGRLKDIQGYEKEFGKQFREAERILRNEGRTAFNKWMRKWMLGSPRRFEELIERLNSLVETNTRLAVYIAGRETGKSKLKAGSMAKNYSINFTKSGEIAPLLDLAFLFANPAIQSTKNYYQYAKAHPVKTGISFMGITIAGFALSALAALMAGDDDEGNSYYYMINETVRKTNVIFFYGSKKDDYIKVPVTQFLSVMYGWGVDITDLVNGKANYIDKIQRVPVDIIQNVSPVNIDLGFHTQQDGRYYVGGAIPQAIKPLYEAYIAGEDAFEMPVSGQNEYNEGIPEYRRSLKSTAKPFVKASEFLNKVSGGDKVQAGAANINPDNIEHIVQGYTGTAGKFYLDTYKTAAYIYNQNFGDKTEELKPSNIPIAGVFYGNVGKGTQRNYYSELYYDMKQEYDKMKSDIREYRKVGENDKAEKIESSNMYKSIRFIGEIEKEMSDLRQVRKKSEDPIEVKQATEEQFGLQKKAFRVNKSDEVDYYDTKAEYNELVNKVLTYRKSKVLGAKENPELDNIYGRLYTPVGRMKSIHTYVSAIEKQIKENNDNVELTPEEKKQQNAELEATATELMNQIIQQP